jgi:hypothetical protein
MKKHKNYKVYFEGSIAGKESYSEHYKRIITALTQANCDVTETIFQVTIEEARERTQVDAKEIYSNILKMIKNSDIFVVDMTYGSPSLAMLIQDAIYRFSKPILMLVYKTKEGKRGVPFAGNTSKLLTIKEYSFENLNEVIADFLKKVKYKVLSTRLSVRLTAEVDEYLEFKKLQTKEISKNQTLLNLFEELMDKDESFQSFIKNRTT